MWRMWLAALFWGLNWPAVKIMLSGGGPWTLRAIGLSAGASVLAMFTVASGVSLKLPRTVWSSVIIAGLLNVAIFNICAVFAQLSMPTSRAAILTFTMPLWTTLFAYLALGERIDRLRAMSLLIGAVGLAVLSLPFVDVIRAGGVPFGLIYVLTAAVCWAAGTVYLKARPIAGAPLAITTWQVAVGAVVCCLGLALFETPRIDLARPEIAAAMLYHILLPQAVSYVLWFGLIRQVSTAAASIGTLLIPIFGVIGSVILLGERPSPVDLAGFSLILGAVLLDQIYRNIRKSPPTLPVDLQKG
jgi:drug/metabolite transporter (DMT)-like permease